MLSDLSNKFPELREKILSPFLVDINPNYLTYSAFIAAVAGGYMYYKGFILFATILVLLNGFLDILDGEIAKKFGKVGRFGDFLDHTFDRLSDVAMLLGLTFSSLIPRSIGFFTIIAVLLVSYMGTQAHAITRRRLYAGILGRSDRLLVLIIIGILYMYYSTAMTLGIMLILVLSVVTFLQRFIETWRKIGE